MGFWDWLVGRRPRLIAPLLALPPDHAAANERQAQQMQQIRDVSQRLDHAAKELDEAQTGLRTMKRDIKDDHGL